MNITELPPLKEVIKNYNLSAKKSLGQNFLLDLNLTRKIAKLANIEEGTTIIEVGCGPAGLTRAILEMYPNNPIIVIEKDERCANALVDLMKDVNGVNVIIDNHSPLEGKSKATKSSFGGGQRTLTVIKGDALEFDYSSVKGKKAIIANLPYNIATPLLIGWLKQISNFESLTLMFQREVANRIVANVNDKAYGRLAVMSNWLCETKIVLNLPPQAFTPPPKVSSAVVHFKEKKDRETVDFNKMEEVVKLAFNQRRKMLRQSCKSILPILEKCGILTTNRAENISVEDYIKIAKEI